MQFTSGVGPLESRNVVIDGHKQTSIRLELSMWQALEAIAQREGLAINALCTLIMERWDEQRRYDDLALGSGLGVLESRNIVMDGHKRTSIRLEPSMWAALEAIARREGLTTNSLCTKIKGRLDEQRRRAAQEPGAKPETAEKKSTFTSAVRVLIASYFVQAATEPGHRKAGHGRGDPFVGTPMDRRKDTRANFPGAQTTADGDALCGRSDPQSEGELHAQNKSTFTSAVRVFISSYFFLAATEKGHVAAKHGLGDPFVDTPFDLPPEPSEDPEVGNSMNGDGPELPSSAPRIGFQSEPFNGSAPQAVIEREDKGDINHVADRSSFQDSGAAESHPAALVEERHSADGLMSRISRWFKRR